MKLNYISLIINVSLVYCSTISPLIQKTVQIADATYSKNFVTSVVWSDTNKEDENTQFLKTFKGSVFALNNKDNEMIRKFYKLIGFKQTIFFANSVDEFVEFLMSLKADIVVPMRVILVLTQPTTDAKINDVTEASWDNYLSDIVILSENGNEIKISTYYPYTEGNCRNHTPVLITDNDWFPKKFISFHGCTIRATVLAFAPYVVFPEDDETSDVMYGLDGLMFSLIVEKLNATLKLIMCRDDGQVGTYVNGNGTGCFGHLINNRSDFFAPTLVLDHIRYPVVQITHPLHMMDLSWFGPPRRPKNQWLRILHPFMTDCSHAANGTLFIFIIITNIIKRYGFQRTQHDESVTFQSLVVLLGQGIRFESQTLLVTCLFVMWVWFCVIIRIAYQVDLVYALQQTILEKPLTILDESLKEVDAYGGLPYPHQALNGTKYYKDYEVLGFNDVRIKAKNISDGERFLLASETFLATELGTGLQRLKIPVSRVLVGFIMRPGWPPAKDVDAVLVKLIEGGFLEQIVRLSVNEWNKKERNSNVNSESQALNMKSLSGCFYGLALIYLICILVFVVEIMYHKLKVKPEITQLF